MFLSRFKCICTLHYVYTELCRWMLKMAEKNRDMVYGLQTLEVLTSYTTFPADYAPVFAIYLHVHTYVDMEVGR